MKQDVADSADVIIVGAGSAGLLTALSLAPLRVIVLSEVPLDGICASRWSQGGIAAAVGENDTIASHAADTLKAAAGTADMEVVHVLTAEAPAAMKALERVGVRFERDTDGNMKLNREACHAHRRILRAAAGDGFGQELMRALTEAVRQVPSITFVGGIVAERIIRRDGPQAGPVQGILARQTEDNKLIVFSAPAVVLAMGGVAGLYAATTNPLNAVGRGIAMAARAGAVLSDLEFVQFHPTALDIGEDPAPLASEALRGEGALLLNSRGERFMPYDHPMAELAPRDIVSRGVFAQMQKGQRVYLDCRHFDVGSFAALRRACARAGINPQHDLVPVMPAAHYHMGGIATDLHGRTSIHGPWGGLWSCGEAAATGLHGANRLASNSLMEAVVMAGRVAADIAGSCKIFPKACSHLELSELPPQTRDRGAERDLLRNIMTEKLGVIRDGQGMMEALRAITEIARLSKKDDSRLADMALVAQMLAVSAFCRTESRGGHFRSDYPESCDIWKKRSFTTLRETDSLMEKLLEDKIQRESVA